MTAPSEIRQYTLTLPPGTPQDHPVKQSMVMPARIVNTIQVIVPPGCNGVVGWRITNSGLPIIPYGSDPWVITSGETINWPISGAIDSGSWGIEGFNLGINLHSVYVRMLVIPPAAGHGPAPVDLAPLTALTSGIS